MSESKFVIWWLDEHALNLVERWALIPSYLRRQLSSFAGRSGRGRLWIDKELGVPESLCVPYHLFEETPIGVWIQVADAGGIVMSKADVPALQSLPGLVTDFNLRRWPLVILD